MNDHPTAWFRRTLRWGQTNITEIDPQRYDIHFWREHWRKTRVQGVIINAGGIVAYYPSAYPLTYYAQFLNGRDLFGELVEAARQEGLAVLARMDSNRVHEAMYFEHPDWMAVDAEGKPYRAGDLYVTSVNSPYYEEYLPDVLREIARTYQPDGFADNSFSGLGREQIDYSPHAARSFRAATGFALPKRKDWNDTSYRAWIGWNYRRRLEIWQINNRVAQEASGKDCLWIGMIGIDYIGQGAAFRDLKGICEQAQMVLVDSQSRGAGGFQQNADGGVMLHNLAGWDRLMPESMAMYEHNGPYPFRVASKPEAEARLWAVAGFAGGIQPWWHHIGAYHEDRRQYRTAESLFRWHEQNEAYLIERRPVAPVGMVWSHENADFYGRDEARVRVEQPWIGLTRALEREHILYQPIHADHIERAEEMGITTLVLPNVGALRESQIEALRRFVERGGSLVASGESGRYDEWGDLRENHPLSDMFGVRFANTALGSLTASASNWDAWSQHSYLRLQPELRAGVYGPQAGQEPAVNGDRHAVIEGFEDTDLIPFGGKLEAVETVGEDAVAPLFFVPPFPVYPPETAWMRHESSRWPGLVLREAPGGGRVAYFAADIDRCYARNPLPDYARLLANVVRWAAKDTLPLQVEGVGNIDCRLYRQGGRLILHLVNLTGTEPRPAVEFIPVGPFKARIKTDGQVYGKVKLLVAGQEVAGTVCAGWLCVDIPQIFDHEVVVIE